MVPTKSDGDLPEGTLAPRTWLEPDEKAYTAKGSMLRKGQAVFSDGQVRAVRAGVPDTYFTVPAKARVKGKYVAGYLTNDEGLWTFHERVG